MRLGKGYGSRTAAFRVVDGNLDARGLLRAVGRAYLYHQSRDTLETEERDGFVTLFGHHAVTVAGGVLRFHAEQETARERLHVDHARCPRRVFDVVGRQVAVRVRDQVPSDAEAEPAEQEAHAEHEQRPPPSGVHQRGEQVLQVAPPQLGHVGQDDVALAVLQQRAPFGFPVDRRGRRMRFSETDTRKKNNRSTTTNGNRDGIRSISDFTGHRRRRFRSFRFLFRSAPPVSCRRRPSRSACG